MKITKVSYGRTIEVGGPFGRQPTEKVWFGWDAEAQSPLDTDESMMAKLHDMANEQERIEKEKYQQRKHGAALERALSKPAHRRDLYEYELVRQQEQGDKTYVITQSTASNLHLQRDDTWGPLTSARRFDEGGAAHTYANNLHLKDFGVTKI